MRKEYVGISLSDFNVKRTHRLSDLYPVSGAETYSHPKFKQMNQLKLEPSVCLIVVGFVVNSLLAWLFVWVHFIILIIIIITISIIVIILLLITSSNRSSSSISSSSNWLANVKNDSL